MRFKLEWLHRPVYLLLAALLINMCSAQTPSRKPERSAEEKSDKQSEVPRAMVLIPGGKFQMGIDQIEVPRFQRYFGINKPKFFDPETPRHTVKLAAFFLDRNLVTNAQFFAFTRRFPHEKTRKPGQAYRPWTEIDPRSRYGDGKNLKQWVNGEVPKA